MAFSRPDGTVEYDYLLKIILIGDMAVGKSSLLLRYVDNTYEDSYVCTIGVDFKIKTIKFEEKTVKLQIWDTAGQERFKPITRCYFGGSHGALVVFDVTNRASYLNAREWIKEYKEYNPKEQCQNLVLIGNKADLAERLVSTEDGKDLGAQLHCRYLETSAKNNEGIEDAFRFIAEEMVKKQRPNAAGGRDALIFRAKSTSLLQPAEPRGRRCC